MAHPPFPIARILAPTDFTPLSHVAVLYAARLAMGLGARVTIQHVLTTPNEMVGIVPGASVAEELETTRTIAEEQMNWIESEVRALGLALVETAIDASSSPARAILNRAATERASLIVLATHGRSGLPRMFIGSVADVLIRTATCPVLTIRPD